MAETAGREALLQSPTRKATEAIASRPSAKPSTAVESAVPTWAAIRVGRRPIRSVSTPAPTDATAAPSPNRDATRPAYEAE